MKKNETWTAQIGKELWISMPLLLYSKEGNTFPKSSINIEEPGYRFLEDGIAYLNLDAIPMDTINDIMPQLEKSKAIIADVRGYPNNNHELIRHLISNRDEHKWMQVGHYIYPDQQGIPGYSDFGWSLEPKMPYLGDKKIIFITDGRAVSYA